MAKQAYVYSGTDWVPLASEVTNLSGYQTKASNQFPNRNLVINGAMQIAQRATSVASISSTGGSYNTADRQQMYIDTAGTWTQSVENDAPIGSGFRKSLKMLCTTADASPSSGDRLYISQLFEGQNLQQIKKGTAAAEQLTVSTPYISPYGYPNNVPGGQKSVEEKKMVYHKYVLIPSTAACYLTIAGYGFCFGH